MELYTIPSGPLRVNTYVVVSEGEAAIIDPGQRNPALYEFIDAHPFRYRYLVLTHGHFDHMVETAGVKRRLPEIEILIHRADAAALTDDSVSLYDQFSPVPAEHVEADRQLSGGERFLLGAETLEIIHTPGHTKGGVSILCGDLLFTGDTLFYRSVGRTDFPGGSFEELRASVLKLFALPGDYRVLPGHEGETRLSEERRENPFVTVEVKSHKGEPL